MVSVDQRNKDYYTDKGFEALVNRTKTLIRLFNEAKFPISELMLGFGKLEISSQEECLARILELSDLTGFQAKLELNNETKKAEIKY